MLTIMNYLDSKEKLEEFKNKYNIDVIIIFSEVNQE